MSIVRFMKVSEQRRSIKAHKRIGAALVADLDQVFVEQKQLPMELTKDWLEQASSMWMRKAERCG